jgi:monomeric isocitrate dehydrogenase
MLRAVVLRKIQTHNNDDVVADKFVVRTSIILSIIDLLISTLRMDETNTYLSDNALSYNASIPRCTNISACLPQFQEFIANLLSTCYA